MLSRTASNLYWLGRYMERAQFTARLLEATVLLDALPTGRSGNAWERALAVLHASDGFTAAGGSPNGLDVGRYLALSAANPSSIRSCLVAARDHARAARAALNRESWEAVNAAFIAARDQPPLDNTEAMLAFAERTKVHSRGFAGALNWMLRNESFWFITLGVFVERGDNTARLIDVKYHLLLPENAQLGGALDRDQWTTILLTMSARLAYRALYREAPKPWLIADLLIFRREMPRSLIACAIETLRLLRELGTRDGRQGEADRLARAREAALRASSIDEVFQGGLHEFVGTFLRENSALDRAVASQFRFS